MWNLTGKWCFAVAIIAWIRTLPVSNSTECPISTDTTFFIVVEHTRLALNNVSTYIKISFMNNLKKLLKIFYVPKQTLIDVFKILYTFLLKVVRKL